MPNEIDKALQILNQISKLTLDEMPVFTWDEMEAATKKAENDCWRYWFVLGCIFGMVFGILLTKFT